MGVFLYIAGVAELADARDSKSRVFTDVSVRPRPPVFHYLKVAATAAFFIRLLFYMFVNGVEFYN